MHPESQSQIVAKKWKEPPHITVEMKQVYIHTTKLPGHSGHSRKGLSKVETHQKHKVSF